MQIFIINVNVISDGIKVSNANKFSVLYPFIGKLIKYAAQ